jgi:hypothetical protein
VSQKKM